MEAQDCSCILSFSSVKSVLYKGERRRPYRPVQLKTTSNLAKVPSPCYKGIIVSSAPLASGRPQTHLKPLIGQVVIDSSSGGL